MKRCTTILFFLSFLINLQAQIQDSTSQVLFAKYLYDKGLYQFAAEEYERLHFIYPDNRFFLSSLFKSERFAGNADRLEVRLNQLNGNDEALNRNYFLALISLDELDKADQILSTRIEAQSEPNYYKFRTGLMLLNREVKTVEDSAKTWQVDDQALYDLISKSREVRQKSPFWAGLFSSVIPATGRFYAGDYKDGLFSLVFIAGTAIQSYNRFNKNGISSAGGWIYGGIGFGFYLGNIWGSVKAAKRYNDKSYQSVYHDTKRYFNSTFLD